jgi:hypothetical protein
VTARRILHGTDFVAAVRSDVRYLPAQDRREWIALLQKDIHELERLLATVPRVGRLMAVRGGHELRKVQLRRTPFVVWYATEPAKRTAPVVLLKLYHLRQKSRRPRW